MYHYQQELGWKGDFMEYGYNIKKQHRDQYEHVGSVVNCFLVRLANHKYPNVANYHYSCKKGIDEVVLCKSKEQKHFESE